jgi:(4-(4-[2-(gamma-L-glutamylamino)ethyl]phenoxymethyl)furan-2-yl)methanamine synthase
MRAEYYAGWDVGGAHLKLAVVDSLGTVIQVEQHATPLWLGLESLENTLKEIKARLRFTPLSHAITTTGELADYFENRSKGVDSLIEKFCKVFDSKEVCIYAGTAGLVSVCEAKKKQALIASANWHASARFVATKKENGILVDIGSSTTDIIPFLSGELCNAGYNDQERMQHDELLYTGIVRTPMMAVVRKVPFKDVWQTVAAEHFATMADIYRITEDLDEKQDLMEAADGGDKSIQGSVRRLARMLGTDVDETTSFSAYRVLARYIADEQENMIGESLQRVISNCHESANLSLVGAGGGRFVVKNLAKRYKLDYLDVQQLLDTEENQKSRAADCLTAVSVAQIKRSTV